jgi:hypothetical protein
MRYQNQGATVRRSPDRFPASVRGILGWNSILHAGWGIFTGIWTANLVAPSGALSFINWIEVLLAVAAVTIGLTYGSYMALRHIPFPQPSRRKAAMLIFVAAYSALALNLSVAAASVLAGAAGENAHMEAGLAKKHIATEERRRAFGLIVNRAPALTECTDTGKAMSIPEATSGAYSREGGDFGRVATTLVNISNACANALEAIYASRANLARLFAKTERLLVDIRRTIDGPLDARAKLIAVRKQSEEFQKLMRAINDALPTETLRSLSDALLKDWNALGLPPAGAAAIIQNFSPLAESLTENLDDIAALKSAPIPSITAETRIAYLYLYPQATIGAIAVGICIELIPLFGLILGFAILSGYASQPNSELRRIETNDDGHEVSWTPAITTVFGR